MSKFNQKITLWTKQGLDMNGVPTYSAPVVYDVRFEKTNRLMVDAQGREIQSQGLIYFQSKVFDIGDYIAEGEHADLSPVKDYYEVKNERVISNLSGTEWEYRATV